MKPLAFCTLFFASCLAALLPRSPSPVQSAQPMIGTDAHGHVYPGATVPFGMVQLSPDTRLETWDGCSGYHYSDKAILGFSHTHLSGTGCGDLGDIRFTPLSGKFYPSKEKDGYHLQASRTPTRRRGPATTACCSTTPKIKAELTATAHAGLHRYTFPAGQAGLPGARSGPRHQQPAGRGAGGQGIEHGPAAVIAAATVGRPTRRSTSSPSSRGRSTAWTIDSRRQGHVEAADAEAQGADSVMARVRFRARRTSRSSSRSASRPSASRRPARTWRPRFPAWDFDGTVAAAEKSWGDFLGRIEIQTADPAIRETFYTALYHSAMAPTLFNDVDGGYRGLDHKVHAGEGFQNYCTFSLWDIFRAELPLLTIIQPQRVDDFVNGMLAHYRQFNQHALPVWPLAGNETWCMIGNHSIPIIVEAYVKGFRGFDAEAAYQAMRDTVMQDRNLQGEYRKLGYVPSADEEPVGLADPGICLRRLVPRPHGPAAGQDRRRRSCSPSGPRTIATCSTPRSDSCAARGPTARGDRRSIPANWSGTTSPKPRAGTTPGSCRTTCRA